MFLQDLTDAYLEFVKLAEQSKNESMKSFYYRKALEVKQAIDKEVKEGKVIEQ